VYLAATTRQHNQHLRTQLALQVLAVRGDAKTVERLLDRLDAPP
jgi:hypothetical protein